MTTLETLKAARELCKRSIQLGLQWNKENHAPAHMLAFQTCKRVGVQSIPEAEEFIAAFDAEITKIETTEVTN